MQKQLTQQEWGQLYDSLIDIANPEVDVLQQFLDAPYTKVFTEPKKEQHHHDYMHALRTKLDALTTKPSPIAKTMTRSQLFLAQDPLWTTNLKPIAIMDLLGTIHWLNNYGKPNIPYLFDIIVQPDGTVNYTELNKLLQ